MLGMAEVNVGSGSSVIARIGGSTSVVTRIMMGVHPGASVVTGYGSVLDRPALVSGRMGWLSGRPTSREAPAALRDVSWSCAKPRRVHFGAPALGIGARVRLDPHLLCTEP